MVVTRAFPVLLVIAVATQARADRKSPAPAKAPAPKPAVNETKLTLADAVRSALAHHPESARIKLDTKIAEADVPRQRGQFDPVLKVSAAGRRENTYYAEAEASANGVNEVDSTWVNGSIEGRTTFGGTYALNFRTSQTEDKGEPGFFIRLAPQYENILFGRYTQALLRGGGFTPNRGQIDRAKLEAALANAEQRRQLEQLALKVVASYWELEVRHERVSISESNLADAVKLREYVERQFKAGRTAHSDITQADVTVAERQQAVDAAELAVIEAERALLDATYLTEGGLRADDTIVLVDKPATQAVKRDFDQDVATALAKRPEFTRAQRALEAARLDAEIAANQRRFRLDIYGEAGVVGFSGINVVPPGLGIPDPPALVQGGFGKSISNMVGGEAPFFEVGVQLEIPLGNRERRAAARQAQLAADKERALDVRSLVIHEVRAAFQRVVIVARRFETATTTLKLAQENVNEQELRYRGGAGVLFDVVRSQEQLASARAAVALAAAEQEVAVLQLEAARGTLLARLGVE